VRNCWNSTKKVIVIPVHTVVRVPPSPIQKDITTTRISSSDVFYSLAVFFPFTFILLYKQAVTFFRFCSHVDDVRIEEKNGEVHTHTHTPVTAHWTTTKRLACSVSSFQMSTDELISSIFHTSSVVVVL
jgi:hypothetical protein